MNVIQLSIAAGYARDLHDGERESLKIARALECGPWYPHRESVAGAWERLCEIGFRLDNRLSAMRSVWGDEVAEQIETCAHEMLDTEDYPYYNTDSPEGSELALHYGGGEEGM